jgi:hypothetical protein
MEKLDSFLLIARCCSLRFSFTQGEGDAVIEEQGIEGRIPSLHFCSKRGQKDPERPAGLFVDDFFFTVSRDDQVAAEKNVALLVLDC